MSGKPKKRHPVTQPLDKPYRFIALTQGQTAIVDAEDFEWLNQWNWFAWWSPDTRCFYAVRSGKRGKRNPNPTRLYMHRVILGCKKRQEEGDHKNHNTLDNRRKNLRKCTRAQNGRNIKMPCTNTSGYKGVFRDKRRKIWFTQIGVNNTSKYVGTFHRPEDAAHAYDEAAKKYYGEFAHLNFPTAL